MATVSIVLDGDVRSEAEEYIRKNSIQNNIPLSFLPVESLEKYLKTRLHDQVDHKLFRKLNDLIFHQVSLTELIAKYRTKVDTLKDKNGKRLYKDIENELHRRRKSRADLVEVVVDHLVESDTQETDRIVSYLKQRLS